MLKIIKVDAVTLPDLWFQALYGVLDHGHRFVIDRGSYAGQTRLEYDYFIGHITNPGFGSGTPEILPEIPPAFGIPNPVEFEYVYGGEGYSRSYVEYIMTGHKEPGESYTYGERLCRFPMEELWADRQHCIDDMDLWTDPSLITVGEGEEQGKLFINQINLIIKTYKEKGHRNNQMVLQVAMPSDLALTDPPCLRSIDTRIQDGKLHFFVYFRSWDLWGGLPANLAGIQALKESMAAEIGVEDGEMVVESKGLHLYGYAEKLAQIRCMKEEADLKITDTKGLT